MKFFQVDFLQFTLRIIIGGIFLYTGITKIIAPIDFAVTIFNYRILPDELIGLAAAVIPWLEILAGLCLLTGICTKGSSMVISGLLIIFIAILIISSARGLDPEHGCFYGADRKAAFRIIFENLVILASALYIFFFDQVMLTPFKIISERNNL